MIVISLSFIIYHLSFSPVRAQDSLLLRDYWFVKQQSSWLTSLNAAGLTKYQSANIAEAEAQFGIGRGGLVNFNESSKTQTLNVAIESFYRVSPSTVFYGRICYDNFTGRDMAGSAFMQQSLLPFDIVEDSVTNTGKKHRDTYQLTGAVGCQLTKAIALGARVDYTSANYAKYKDLRHKNKLMDLSATIGLLSTFNVPRSTFNVGADYRYHRSTESLTFSTYGKSDKVYKSLINYGPFIGQVEQFGSYGYTDKSREMPLFDESHGAGLQVEAVPSARVRIFASAAYDHRKGYYGRKSPYTITYTNHKGDRLSLTASLRYHTEKAQHILDATYSSEQLRNNGNSHRELQNEAGSNYYEYYGDIKTGDKLLRQTTIAYTAHLGINGELPAWTLQAGMNIMNRRQTGYLYPYLRRQDIGNVGFTISATRNFLLQRGVLSVHAVFGYQKGHGEPFEDATLATPSDKQTPPDEMPVWLWREYQYLVAAQYAARAGVKYAFMLPGTKIKAHAGIKLEHQKANETYQYSNGKDHTQIMAAVGCTF